MKKIVTCLALAAAVMTFAGAVQAESMLEPLISVSSTSVDFGEVPTTAIAEAQITITNDGDFPLVVDAVKTRTPFMDNINRPFTVYSGNSAVITVYFAPTSVGTFNGICTIQSNAANDPVLNIPLTGEGVTE